MKEQVLFIAPFKKLAEDAYLVIEERFSDKKDLFKVVEADLVEAEEVVKKYINDGIEVIVSRGGTASLLEKEVDIPMVYIQVTITDILQSLLELKKMPDNIGIAGFENMIYGVEEIAKILNTNFVEILISKAEEADMKINRAINRGIDFIVGDAISVKLAKKYGINGKFINSGKESIYRALQEALLIAKVRRQDEHKSEMIRTIIQKSHDGIIATNEENRISLFNPEAEKIFHRIKYEVLGKKVEDICSSINEKKLNEKITKYKTETIQIETRIREISMANGDYSIQYTGGIMIWPVAKSGTVITSDYGTRQHPIQGVTNFHLGIDIGNAYYGTPAVAALGGVVTYAGELGSYGNCVIIQHGDGISTLYGHGQKVLTQIGAQVQQGDVIMEIGSTGNSTGPHLHFEVRINGATVDPLNYVKAP